MHINAFPLKWKSISKQSHFSNFNFPLKLWHSCSLGKINTCPWGRGQILDIYRFSPPCLPHGSVLVAGSTLLPESPFNTWWFLKCLLQLQNLMVPPYWFLPQPARMYNGRSDSGSKQFGTIQTNLPTSHTSLWHINVHLFLHHQQTWDNWVCNLALYTTQGWSTIFIKKSTG